MLTLLPLLAAGGGRHRLGTQDVLCQVRREVGLDKAWTQCWASGNC